MKKSTERSKAQKAAIGRQQQARAVQRKQIKEQFSDDPHFKELERRAKQDEDFSQAAARIVRQATEDK